MNRRPVTPGQDVEDLTGRARIREAAMLHFAEQGFDRTTIRGIAETAGVAPSLVRHHFGSKQGLREACDEHLVKTIRRLNAQIENAGLDAAGDIHPGTTIGPYQRYLARALSEGGAAMLFDEIVSLNERWLAEADTDRADRPRADLRARATVRTAMALSIAVLFEHVSRSMGVDLTSQEGERLLMRALLDVHSHPLLTPQEAATASDTLDRAQSDPDR
jgi:AcrR family transcriptional regulator